MNDKSFEMKSEGVIGKHVSRIACRDKRAATQTNGNTEERHLTTNMPSRPTTEKISEYSHADGEINVIQIKRAATTTGEIK